MFGWASDLWQIIKAALKLMVVPAQFSAAILLIATKVTLVLFVTTFIVTIYNKLNSFLDYFNSGIQMSGMLSYTFQFMSAIGLLDAIQMIFSSWSVVFIALALHKLTQLAFGMVDKMSDELYKIGMLTTQ